ncbi:MAG: DUF4339 domain-containing protein [Prosthecobacter sp.]|nr:DUF4339 domain-containing protein [Prosthecobacter sp.]
MNWYFNNEGMADGPYDEPTMTDFAGGGRVRADTLVWQPTMNAWQETAAVNPPWWRPGAAPASAPAPSSVPLARPTTGHLSSELRRTPVPNAPTDVLPFQSRPGFFKRLFGKKK